LTSIPPKIGQLNNLRELYLNDNNLTSISGIFNSCGSEGYPPEIGQLKNLRIFVLCNNKLTSLPSEIGQLTNLYELCLDDNKSIQIPFPTNLYECDYHFYKSRYADDTSESTDQELEITDSLIIEARE
jgi:Leucine-rich repeat (LRR) protein